MALELLFDVPEEVALRQEKWGAQGQELPALKGNRQCGVSAGSAPTALSHRAFGTLSSPEPPTFSGCWDGQVGQAVPRTAVAQSGYIDTQKGR